MTPWDPFSDNPYRLCGWTTDLPAGTLPAEFGPVVHSPGLAPATPSQIEQAHQRLGHDRDRLLWFTAPDPLDRLALEFVLKDFPEDARRLWEPDPRPESRHNLAILCHLSWLAGAATPTDVARRWADLAQHHPPYTQVTDLFADWIRHRSLHEISHGRSVREDLQVLAVLQGPDAAEEHERELFADDALRLNLMLGHTLKQMHERWPLTHILADVSQQLLPPLEVLLHSTRPDGTLHREWSCRVGELLVNLARQARAEGLADAEEWLGRAAALAPSALRADLEGERNSWQAQNAAPRARAVEVAPLPPERRSRLGFGAVGLILAALALTWAFQHPPANPVGEGATRAAVQRQADSLAEKLSPVAARLAEIDRALPAAGPRRPALEAEQTSLKQRYQSEKAELIKLQRWLDSHK